MEAAERDGGSNDPSLKGLGDGLLRRLSAVRHLNVGGGARVWRDRLLTPSTIPGLLLLAAFSALSGTGILFVLNSESLLVQNQSYSAALALVFVGVLIAYRLTQQRVISRASAAVEHSLHAWRTRIAGKVVRLSPRDTEELSRGRMLDGLAKHYEQLSQTIVPLMAGLEATMELSKSPNSKIVIMGNGEGGLPMILDGFGREIPGAAPREPSSAPARTNAR
jgi:hypothetical protein